MAKEKSKGWLEFRAKAGQWFRAVFLRLRQGVKAGAIRFGHWCVENFRMEKDPALTVVKEGLFLRNPLLVLSLGVTCALSTTEDMKSAAAMGLCALFVLVGAELTVSLTRRWTPEKARWLWDTMIVASFTAATGLLLQVAAPNRADELGVYVPLLATSCLVLNRTRGFAAEHLPGYALLDGLTQGVGYAGGLLLLAAVRELLGAGALWGVDLVGEGLHPVHLLTTPCGGFLTLGLLLALVQWLRGRTWRKGETQA